MSIEYKIIPTRNTIIKSYDGLSWVIKEVYCDVEGTDELGNKSVITDLLTILPFPESNSYLEFTDITKPIMIEWITSVDTIKLDSIKKTIEYELKQKAESPVIVNAKLPWE
jgi:hypothetical protein